MSLFVGNINKKTSKSSLQDLFGRYGRCQIDQKANYAFIEFESHHQAEKAKKDLDGKRFEDNTLSVEWSRKHNSKNETKPASQSSSSNQKHSTQSSNNKKGKSKLECYICGELGHIAKECKKASNQEHGNTLPFQRENVLDRIRRERNSYRVRLRSPNRYTKFMQIYGNSLSILKPI